MTYRGKRGVLNKLAAIKQPPPFSRKPTPLRSNFSLMVWNPYLSHFHLALYHWLSIVVGVTVAARRQGARPRLT